MDGREKGEPAHASKGLAPPSLVCFAKGSLSYAGLDARI